jgi:hypothetical protein
MIAISGCAGQEQAPAAGTTPPAPADAAQLHPDDDESPLPAPTWSDEARTNAIKAAEEGMRAFSAKTSSDDWLENLARHLTPAARTAYSTVNPARVPATFVTGAGELVDESSAYLAVVDVPTDAGVYSVLLQRSADTEPWLIERITREVP